MCGFIQILIRLLDGLKLKKKGSSIVFTTYQSGEAIAKAAKKAKVVFDVGIMDEAHKTVGKKESLFTHLLP